MGAWGKGTFENDTACDFAATVAEGNGLVVLEQALAACRTGVSIYAK